MQKQKHILEWNVLQNVEGLNVQDKGDNIYIINPRTTPTYCDKTEVLRKRILRKFLLTPSQKVAFFQERPIC